MPAIIDDRDRQVVPRWRSFESTVAFGELSPLRQRPAGAFTISMLEPLLEDWKREPSLSVAADLVSGAFTLGLIDAVKDAALFVHQHENAPKAAREIAARCLGLEDHAWNRSPAASGLKPQKLIRSIRIRLADYPFNPIAWTNLSLGYTTLGHRDKASRAMRIALSLAPDNRFVLRAACRLFLHQGDPEHAHAVLLGSASVKHDPWILAGEIAMSAVRKRSSSLVKVGRRMIESKNMSPFHLSELAGALATLEATGGSMKQAKRLCRFSLEKPAENAIAQAAWLDRQIGGFDVSTPPDTSIESHEANAWTLSISGLWENALSEAKAWHVDQPFSSRPAALAAYIAITAFDDFDDAVSTLEVGLRSNQDDVILRNNLAFALAQQGKLVEARDAIATATVGNLTPQQYVCLTATQGLIAFRAGNTERGRQLYQLAISASKGESLESHRALATVYLALEELRIGSANAETKKQQAIKATEKFPSAVATLFVKKLNEANSPVPH